MSDGLVDGLGAVLLGALVAYGVMGGADFGGGVWDLLARGRRKREQREAIEAALGPIWEANHVWLIFVIVLLFTAWPVAFSAAMTALHIPILFALLGIVLRGAAFAFRKHDARRDTTFTRWSTVFGASSVLAPFFLGVSLTALSTGKVRVDPEGNVTTGFVAGWTTPFAGLVGLLAVVLFAHLAAVYLTVDARSRPAVRRDFRRRALLSGAFALPLAFLVLWLARTAAPVLYAGLTTGLALLLVAAGALGGAVTLGALWYARDRLARASAFLTVSTILAGWGIAQRPYLIVPDVTLHGAAAPEPTLRLMAWGLASGAVLLVPSLVYLFRVFKGGADPLDV